jgi:hypothetical protein
MPLEGGTSRAELSGEESRQTGIAETAASSI